MFKGIRKKCLFEKLPEDRDIPISVHSPRCYCLDLQEAALSDCGSSLFFASSIGLTSSSISPAINKGEAISLAYLVYYRNSKETYREKKYIVAHRKI
jgi:hypothetical protein